MNRFVQPRPYADPEAAMRKILELANAFTPIQDARIYIEAINGPMIFQEKATPRSLPLFTFMLLGLSVTHHPSENFQNETARPSRRNVERGCHFCIVGSRSTHEGPRGHQLFYDKRNHSSGRELAPQLRWSSRVYRQKFTTLRLKAAPTRSLRTGSDVRTAQ